MYWVCDELDSGAILHSWLSIKKDAAMTHKRILCKKINSRRQVRLLLFAPFYKIAAEAADFITNQGVT